MRDNDETQGHIDETDVEGHRHVAKDAEPEGARRVSKDGEPEGARRRTERADDSDDDVEGHRMLGKDGEPESLFKSGPSTQGEYTKRAPTDNPHGER